MQLENGSRLGHYHVVALIGKGGMGEVYRATDTRLHRDVALKVLPADVAADPGRVARFQREARAVAGLNHPHVVTIHSVEESGGLHFLTMELVEGQTLGALLNGNGVSAEQFLAVALPLTDGVAAAHARGITHRDLKPQNVMFGRDGRLKVLDFGLAKFAEIRSAGMHPDDVSTALQTHEGVVGTLPYMSPEQAEGRMVDVRSDVFSLGAIFYEMATGRRPFGGKSAFALMAAIIQDDPPPVATLAPALPPALHDVIKRSLAKDPDERYRDAAALHLALREIALPAQPAGFHPVAGDASRSRPDRPPLVGRHVEHGRLAEHLQAAAGGRGALVLLAGEPGVGKTRLAEELLRDARKRGMLALTGHCYEEGTAPFSPFVEILEQLLREVPAPMLREALGEDAPDIARLVPGIKSVWHDLPEPGQLEPEQQRRVLFNAIVHLFRRIGAQGPVVVLLDDLHWAEEATVGLLQHLAPHLPGLPVLLLATYRDIDFEVGKPFEKAMATLIRLEQTVRMVVRCLPQLAVGELLTAFGGGSQPPATLVEAIFHETEGNPFFVGEVFRHLSEEGRLFDATGSWKTGLTVDALGVPEGVRLVIGRRIARLSAATPTLLTTAAVVGRQFDLKLVEALGTLEGDAFLDAIEEAEAARLITSERAGRQTRYVFTHEIVRSTLLSSLSLPRRQRIEARVAKTIQTLYQAHLTDHAAAIAHHLYEAGPAADETETIRFLTLASDQSVAAGGFEKGLRLIEQALSMVHGGDLRTGVALRLKYGLARRSLGQLFEAIDAWEAALRLGEGGVDPGATAALCHELAHSYAWTGQPALGARAARRALAALGPEASSNRCRLLADLGWSLSIGCDFESADPIMRDAIAMAHTLGDDQLLGESLLLNSWHYYLCMRRREQADACRHAVELLRPTGDIAKLGEALANIQMACIQLGRPHDIARTEEETRTLAERLGRFDIRSHQLFSETERDWLITGDLDSLDVALRQVEGVAGAWQWIAEACQSQLLVWRGRLEAATDRARTSLSHEPDGGTHTGFGWGMLFLCECTAGQRERALTLLDEHAGHLPRTGRLNTIGSWYALFKVIEGLAVVGESQRAAAFYPIVVEALAAETVVTFDSSHLLETVAGIAAAAGGEWDAAEAHYRTALRLAGEMPFISEQAEARHWYARMLVDRGGPGDRQQARGLLETALKAYRKIGMAWHVERSEALLSEMLG
jgi:tetratricopeptide (TPR) repeat protein